MQKKSIAILIVLAVITLFASCAKEGPSGPDGLPGPNFTGDINGFVSLYDQYGSPVLTGLYKAELSLDGAAPAIADSSGYYAFAAGSVSTGYYNITATDSGYASTILTHVQYISGLLYLDVKLSAIPQFSSTGFTSTTDNLTKNDSLVITITPDTRPRNCIIFVNNTASTGDTTTPPSYLLSYIKAIAANDTVESLLIPAQDLYNAGFTSGKMAYFSEFSYVVNDASVFEDTLSGQKVYYAISHPKLDSAGVP